MATHQTFLQRIESNFEQEVRFETWQGDFDSLKAKLDEIVLLQPNAEGVVCTGGSLVKREGGRGTLELSYKTADGVAWWGVTFSEISKPIQTWLATQIQDKSTLLAELAKISLWEQQRSNGNTEAYSQFRYDGTNRLTGSTLKLAEKMLNGIESYSIYAPVATCRRMQTLAFTDDIGLIGKYTTYLYRPGPMLYEAEMQLAAIEMLKDIWLKTGDDITCNSDGTFSRTEQWTGLDEIDADLYEEA